MNEIIHTEFGNAKIKNDGYYEITSRKEGNHNQRLHRLIYEKFWGVKLPSEVIIHHKDGNKLNNCILNLEAMTVEEHNTLHHSGKKVCHSTNTIEKMSLSKQGENNPMYGKSHSFETKLKMSESRNTTGYFRVSKSKSNRVKQGYIWCYDYLENGKPKKISSINLEKLKDKVISKGLVWRKI